MSSLTDRGVRRVEWFELVGRIGITAAGYPFEYVKVLIQIGHEPFPPRPVKTLFGRPALALPGIWTYMRHIRDVDGFRGLYRGLTPKLCTNLVNGFTYTMVYEKLNTLYPETREEEEEEITEEQRITRFLHSTLKTTVSKLAAILASQPLHVITIRAMAQFVGREEKYGSLFSSLWEVYRENGISGYFSGLIPRVISELVSLWLASTAAFFINTYIVEEKTLKGYIKASMVYLTSALLYPFVVVSNVLAVNNCGLAAGLPPNMPIYISWTDCWSHLSAIGQLKRGSSILWRYYQGPLKLEIYDKPSQYKTRNYP